jgi:DNA-binding CsgD family transcriptional regulator
METAQRGRPPKADEDRRTVTLRIRLTEAERELLDESAGGKTSTWARDVLLKSAKKKR